MNSILFYPEEIQGSRVSLRGERRAYLQSDHVIAVGNTYAAGVLHGNRGKAECTSISDDEVTFDVILNEPPLVKSQSAFVVAVPRPQTVKKVIQSVTSFGASSLHFIKTKHVVPSYLSSKSLMPEAIQREVFRALEQTRDTIPPEICIHATWRGFIQHTLGELSQHYAHRYVAHTKGESPLKSSLSSLIAAVGPESGWADEEVTQLESFGFKTCSLGERMLRVEHAVAKLLSFIDE